MEGKIKRHGMRSHKKENERNLREREREVERNEKEIMRGRGDGKKIKFLFLNVRMNTHA